MDGNEVNELNETILGLIILMITASVAVYLISSASRYDHAVSDLSMHKASSYYTLAYGDAEYYIPAETVVSDIQNSRGTLQVMINGVPMTDDMKTKVVNRNASAVTGLKHQLGSEQYKKVTIYDSNGNVTALNFEGGH